MKIRGKSFRTIWEDPEDDSGVLIIDQTLLPFEFKVARLSCFRDFVSAIRDMRVRGAGLIGAAAGYGMLAAAREAEDNSFERDISRAADILLSTRPTAVNLRAAVEAQLAAMREGGKPDEKRARARAMARKIAEDDAESCRRIGIHGLPLLENIAERKGGGQVEVLTHCNAGALAFVDYGSALSPVYQAHERGIKVHVWVDETRPRNQGASLTCWELGENGVPHTLIADNAGGHLMRKGMVDIVLVGADRVSLRGDAANKIGTYLKALAAFDNGIPFYAALPSSSIDPAIRDALAEIPIEEREGEEVLYIRGLLEEETGERLARLRICPRGTKAANYGFDITPARLISGLITERGICPASEEGILSLFPEFRGRTA